MEITPAAPAMLQRQQAVAVIAARQKIVKGAVGMVQMAIDTLSKDETVVLDEERKASMVSNLMVVLCGNKKADTLLGMGAKSVVLKGIARSDGKIILSSAEYLFQ